MFFDRRISIHDPIYVDFYLMIFKSLKVSSRFSKYHMDGNVMKLTSEVCLIDFQENKRDWVCE